MLPDLEIGSQAANHENPIGFTRCTFFWSAVDQLFVVCVVDDQELNPSQFFM